MKPVNRLDSIGETVAEARPDTLVRKAGQASEKAQDWMEKYLYRPGQKKAPAPAIETPPAPAAKSKSSSYSSGYSRSDEFAPVASPAKPAGEGEIDPAYLVAGAAAAGLGAAALRPRSDEKHKPTELEALGNTVIGGLDAAAGTLGSVTGMTGMVLGLGGQMVVPTLAGGLGLVGAKGASRTIMKPLDYLNETTVEAFAAKHIPTHISANVSKASNTLAGVASVPLGTMSKLPLLGSLKAENIKSLPTQIKQSSLMHATLSSSFIAMGGLQMYGVAREFSGMVQAMEELEHDLTGKKVSAAGVLLGNVSKPVAALRTQLLQTDGTHMLAAMANLGINIAMAFSNRLGFMSSMLMFQAPELINTVAEGVFGHSPLPVYSGLRAAYNAGQEIPAEAYAEFLLLSSKELRDHGSRGKRMASEIAKEYAGQHVSPAEVLRKVYNGEMKARMEAIVDSQPQVSHVDRLKNKARTVAAEKFPQPVGNFTSRLHEQAQLAEMTPPSPSLN
ncbi:MAG: hypothetical protein SFX19_03880 [Alphaproteobacteria bacterium]|nr:hypothetical protein [Alphaproteobacteria bacterium]